MLGDPLPCHPRRLYTPSSSAPLYLVILGESRGSMGLELRRWIPAFAGMTELEPARLPRRPYTPSSSAKAGDPWVEVAPLDSCFRRNDGIKPPHHWPSSRPQRLQLVNRHQLAAIPDHFIMPRLLDRHHTLGCKQPPAS